MFGEGEKGNLAVVANSNMFGALALLCLVLILTARRRGFRESLLHRGVLALVLRLTIERWLARNFVCADGMRYALQSVKREREGLQRSWTLKDGAFCP
jgi:hypothetical protein